MEYTPKKKKSKDLFIWIFFGIAFAIYLIVSVRFPRLAGKLWFNLLSKLLMALPTVLYAILKKEKAPIFLRILLGLFGLSWFLSHVLSSYKEYLLVIIALIWVSVIAACIYCIYPLCERYDCRGIKQNLGVACLIHSFLILSDVSNYVYVEDKFFRFIVPVIIVSVIVTAVTGFLSLYGYIQLRDDRLSERIAIIVCAFFISMSLTWITASHLNYALDGEGQEHERVVVEKYENMNGDDKYRLILELDGDRLNLEVSKTAYDNHNIGDTVRLRYYDGAFGESFYLN